MKKFFASLAIVFSVFGGFLTVPVGVVYGQESGADQSVNIGTKVGIEKTLSGACGIDQLINCFIWILYNLMYFTFVVLRLVANLLDFFLGYTIDSNAYTAEFIVKGWGVIRDIANVAFIFALLYLAIRHILGLGATKYIPTLIIAALLINFSLFFTRVATDAGNILARVFYNSIVVGDSVENSSEIGYKSISIGLVDKINPQRLLNQSLFNTREVSVTGNYDPGTNTMNDVALDASSINQRAGWFTVIFILMGFVNITLALAFLSVALLMIGRTVGLWFSMIFSPIAFMSLAIPGGLGAISKRFSFDAWKDNLIKLAFMVPIFIFFLYLTIMFLDIIFAVNIPTDNASSFMLLMEIFIPFAFVIILIRTAKKTAEEMAGEFGSVVKSVFGKVAGFVGGAALGATAFAGRATLGRLASARLSSGNYNQRIADAAQRAKDAEKNKDPLARARALADLKRLEFSKASLEKARSSSFDIRNASKAKGWIGGASGFIGGQLKTGMNEFGGAGMSLGAGSSQSRASYEKAEEEKKLNKANSIEQVGRNELAPTLDRMLKRGDSEAEIMSHVDKSLSGLDKTMSGLDPNSDLYKQKEAEYTRLRSMKSEVAAAGGDMSKISSIIKDGKVIDQNTGNLVDYDPTKHGPNGWTGTGSEVKAKMKQRRNQYADRVEEDTWYSTTTGENEYTADKIRRGDNVKSNKDKAIEAMKKLIEEDEGKNNPPPPPPNP